MPAEEADNMSHIPSSDSLRSLLAGHSSNDVAAMAVMWAHKVNESKLSAEEIQTIKAFIDAQKNGFIGNEAEHHTVARVISTLHDETNGGVGLAVQLGMEEGELNAVVSDAKADYADDVRSERYRYIEQSEDIESTLRQQALGLAVRAPNNEAQVQQRLMEYEQLSNEQPMAGAENELANQQPQANQAAEESIGSRVADEEPGPPEPPDDAPGMGF